MTRFNGWIATLPGSLMTIGTGGTRSICPVWTLSIARIGDT
jgi:hypothetical protein